MPTVEGTTRILDDVDRDTAKVDGGTHKVDSSSGKFVVQVLVIIWLVKYYCNGLSKCRWNMTYSWNS